MIINDIIKRIMSIFYNHRHHTNIYSTKASLDAKYEKNVMISENVTITPDVSIGKYSYVNKNSSVENCSIGNYCSISSGVWICPYEHHLTTITTHPFINTICTEKRKRVTIGNDVLISLNAILLNGVHIGDGAVIAAGAVVTHDVEPFEIVGGVPAKHIGWRFPDDLKEKVLSMKWWEKDVEEIMRNKELLEFMVNKHKLK